MNLDGNEPAPHQNPIRVADAESRAPPAKIWDGDLLRHPLLVALIGFILTGLLGNYLAARFSDQSHNKDIELSTRSTALAAISDISDLTSERRERAVLVASAINRSATAAETDLRKQAYDEAYVRWNARVPGDLLRIRSALRLAYRPPYEKYVDALTNIDAIDSGSAPPSRMYGQPGSHRPGLLTIMDACLTNSYDIYRSSGYNSSSSEAKVTIKSCKFGELYDRSIFCFATIAELIYNAIGSVEQTRSEHSSKEEVRQACSPPVT